MNRERLNRWGLFGAGMLAGATGALFYLGYVEVGVVCLVLTGSALWGALRMRPEYDEPEERGIVGDADLTELALFVAELALGGMRSIGRTIPPSVKEIEQLEGRLNALLDHMGAPAANREELKEGFEKLKGRTRRNEGGIALIRSKRL